MKWGHLENGTNMISFIIMKNKPICVFHLVLILSVISCTSPHSHFFQGTDSRCAVSQLVRTGCGFNLNKAQTPLLIYLLNKVSWSCLKHLTAALFTASTRAERRLSISRKHYFSPLCFCITFSCSALTDIKDESRSGPLSRRAVIHCCESGVEDECVKHTWHYYTNIPTSVGDCFQQHAVIYPQCLGVGKINLMQQIPVNKSYFNVMLLCLLLRWWIAAFKGSSVSPRWFWCGNRITDTSLE